MFPNEVTDITCRLTFMFHYRIQTPHFLTLCNEYIPTIKMFPDEVTGITRSFQSYKVCNLSFKTQFFLTDGNNYSFLNDITRNISVQTSIKDSFLDPPGENVSPNGTSCHSIFISRQEKHLIAIHDRQLVGGPYEYTSLNKQCLIY